MKLVRLVVAESALLICRATIASDLHPIVEVANGYLLGAIADGKWIKADDAAKSMADETTYRVYDLTQSLGEAEGGKPKHEDVPCEETLSVSLAPEAGKRRDRGRGNTECVAAKGTGARFDPESLCRCGARFFENKRNRTAESED